MKQRIEVFERLNQYHIGYEIQEHSAVFTIEESAELIGTARGEIAKNLFLKDAKGKRHFLVVMCHEKKADLKALSEALSSSSLSFASEKRLMKYLGLTKGSVTPMGILHDTDCHVIVVLDKDLEEKKLIGVHPNDNMATVWLSFRDLETFIKAQGNPICYVKI